MTNKTDKFGARRPEPIFDAKALTSLVGLPVHHVPPLDFDFPEYDEPRRVDEIAKHAKTLKHPPRSPALHIIARGLSPEAAARILGLEERDETESPLEGWSSSGRPVGT